MKKGCSVDGGRGICPLFFFPTPGDSTAQESLLPRICCPRQKKCYCPGVSPGDGGRGGGWAQVELTDALWRKENEKEKRVVFFFTTFQSNGLHPERLGTFLSCWEYRNHYHKRRIFQYQFINFKLSLSVFLPFLRTSFGEISEIRRRVCFKF